MDPAPLEPPVELSTSTNYIGLMFRRRVPGLDTDTVIQMFTGDEFLHVDVLFVPELPQGRDPARESERDEKMRQVFTTFVREHFRGYVPLEWTSRTDESHLLMVIPVTQEEYERSRAYIADLCHAKTPYNYLDLILCAMPKWCSRDLAHDPDPYPLPSTVFCSQAALLMLRHALPRHAAGGVLYTINSRACRPQDLYRIMKGSFYRVDVAGFVRDRRLTVRGF